MSDFIHKFHDYLKQKQDKFFKNVKYNTSKSTLSLGKLTDESAVQKCL